MSRLEDIHLPTKYGDFDMIAYDSGVIDFPHFALVSKKWDKMTIPAVRIHSECITGDVFSSARCDCGEQLDYAMQYVQESGGIVLYLRQEGRGIGIINKMKAYNLQDQGYDTVQANLKLGLHQDARNYAIAVEMLNDLQVDKIKLLTNNPLKIKEIRDNGIEVVERLPIQIKEHEKNRGYLKTKKDHMGHLLLGLE